MTQAMKSSAAREGENLRQKVEVLTGERGDGRNRAVLARELDGLNNALAGVNKATGSLASSIKGAKGSIHTLAETLTQIGNLLNDNSTDIGDAKTRLDAAEQQLDTLAQAVDAIEGDVTILKQNAQQMAGVGVAGATPATIAIAPSAAQYNAVVSDLAALRAAISGLISANS